MKKILLFFVFVFLSFTVSNNLYALTISASAYGASSLDPVAYPNDIQNGDFTVSGNDPLALVGDGIDESTTWTFDFTSDPKYSSFDISETLISAWLELSLTPKDGKITTDSVRVNGLPGITTQIQSLSVGNPTTVMFDLLDYYLADQIAGVFNANVLGKIGMHYHDDSIVSYANLSLSTAPVPEPATILLFATGLAGLAGFSRRKKK